jgi:hypothetical protein
MALFAATGVQCREYGNLRRYFDLIQIGSITAASSFWHAVFHEAGWRI